MPPRITKILVFSQIAFDVFVVINIWSTSVWQGKVTEVITSLLDQGF